MKFILKAIQTTLLFGLLILTSSCGSQEITGSKNSLVQTPPQTLTIGDTVTKMDASIWVVFQDKKNNYWFGSRNQGVYKYDQHSIIHYTVDDGLVSNSILGIQEDPFGNIYFDTPEGVGKFTPPPPDQLAKSPTLTTLAIADSDPSQNQWQSNPDDLWFRMGWDKNGPYRYAPSGDQLLHHLKFPKPARADTFYAEHPNASYNPYGIYTWYKDRQGRLWFGTASLGVCRYDPAAAQSGTPSISWLYEEQLTHTPGGGDFGIRSIIEDQDGFFWFCNTRYRYEILPGSYAKQGTNLIDYRKENGPGHSTLNSEDDFPYFLSIVEDPKGDLWMATYDEGVWRNDGKNLLHYPVKDGDKNVLLFSIYHDRKGMLWLGTQGAGVYWFNGEAFVPFELATGKE